MTESEFASPHLPFTCPSPVLFFFSSIFPFPIGRLSSSFPIQSPIFLYLDVPFFSSFRFRFLFSCVSFRLHCLHLCLLSNSFKFFSFYYVIDLNIKRSYFQIFDVFFFGFFSICSSTFIHQTRNNSKNHYLSSLCPSFF